MEITLLTSDSIRIKTKTATFVVEPFGGKIKTQADAVFVFSRENALSVDGVEGSPVIFAGPGEYELKGIKFTGIGKVLSSGYQGKIEGMEVCVTKASLAAQAKELFSEYDVVIIHEDVLLDQAILASMNARVTILYGEKAAEHIKTVGKEVSPVSKYTITKDKLPQESEIILLA